MNHPSSKAHAATLLILGCLLLAISGPAPATELVLKDGRILRGKMALSGGLSERPDAAADGPSPKTIVMLDDDLRRTFVPIPSVKEWRQEQDPEVLEKFRFRQAVTETGPELKSVGPFVKVTPFSEFGRRTVTLWDGRKSIDVIQAITELTPRYARVQGMRVQGASYVWDMRIATNSIPAAQLTKILAKLAADGDTDQRRRIARFYMQCERFGDAANQVAAILKSAPNDADLKQQLEPVLKSIEQARAKQLLAELSLRRDAGQPRFVLEALKQFPEEGTAAETLQAVREMIQEFEKQDAACKDVLAQFDALAAKTGDAALAKQLAPVRAEIAADLNRSTLGRMAAFRELAGDASIPPRDKLALAISGWLLGTGGATPTQLSTAMSLVRLRDQVRQYLAAPDKAARDAILKSFGSEEGATPAMVARLVANMKPAIDTPPPGEPGQPYSLQVPEQSKSPTARYLVGLPPEYDPYRRYPAIVALRGPGMTPQKEIDWWAGQASRHGYIVVSPEWPGDRSEKYQFSSREQTTVLDSLWDACRRFSIDTDRVFLSGHSTGGDAAWDIALAHPDLWAGVIPIAARSDRYTANYWVNASLLPLYFVVGELDGDRMAKNAKDWDRMMNRYFNVTVVEYRGRGHDGLSDETLRLFDWMGRCRRNFSPKQFSTISMRPWDNRFWWLELDRLPTQVMTDPTEWDSRRAHPHLPIKGTITATNGVNVQANAGQVTVWLSPDMVDLGGRVTVTINGHRAGGNPPSVVPDIVTLLDDVRSRGDRQHPFWAKVQWPSPATSAGKSEDGSSAANPTNRRGSR